MKMQNNKNNTDLLELENKLGYKFKNTDNLNCALTHSSYTNEQRAKGFDYPSNERLEFLGDSVLSLITSEYIYLKYPLLTEGELSKLRSAVVCERALGKYANNISLGKYLFMGRGEESTGGRSRISILTDAFEAVLAAVYLDGGIEAANNFIIPFIENETDEIIKSGRTEDYKTMLQQIIQQDPNEMLEYVAVSEDGPAHNKIFYVEARLNNNIIGRGTGKSKREAEQNAAREAMNLFGQKV